MINQLLVSGLRRSVLKKLPYISSNDSFNLAIDNAISFIYLMSSLFSSPAYLIVP